MPILQYADAFVVTQNVGVVSIVRGTMQPAFWHVESERLINWPVPPSDVKLMTVMMGGIGSEGACGAPSCFFQPKILLTMISSFPLDDPPLCQYTVKFPLVPDHPEGWEIVVSPLLM